MALMALTGALLLAALPAGALRAALVDLDLATLRAAGPAIVPDLVRLYEEGDVEQRYLVARAFYNLNWRSPEAKRALMADVHTEDAKLRPIVQYALGRVSGDDDVVAVLLRNMREDPNPFFRDKSACALAYDQPYLTPAQKGRLFAALVDALEDDKPDVRSIALQALHIHTGQTKGYAPNAAPEGRRLAVAEWRRWLAVYQANVEAASAP